MNDFEGEKMKKNETDNTLFGCAKSFEKSVIAVFGAPFDSTTSYRPGARFASKAVRGESYGFETYSPYLEKDLNDIFFSDEGDIELPFGDPEKALNMIEEFTSGILIENKIPVMVGGEHLVTLGAVKAVREKHSDIHVIQFDAHVDLRDNYLGQQLSHASVMRRIWDILGDSKIFQFGIRSGERKEFEWGALHTRINKYDLDGLEKTVENLKGKPVYLTVDLDVLDPSCCPGTGTPEPGGIMYEELQNAITFVCSSLDVVGADITELAPNYDPSGISVAAACKLLRELLLSLS